MSKAPNNKKAIIENLNCWLSSFSEDTSQNICSLYDEQASLWGTLSPIRRDSKALIKDYFDQIFKFQNRCVELTESSVRIFGDVGICSGQYTFGWVNDGLNVSTNARFSYVYINKDGRWFIIEHHSSFIPLAE